MLVKFVDKKLYNFCLALGDVYEVVKEGEAGFGSGKGYMLQQPIPNNNKGTPKSWFYYPIDCFEIVSQINVDPKIYDLLTYLKFCNSMLPHAKDEKIGTIIDAKQAWPLTYDGCDKAYWICTNSNERTNYGYAIKLKNNKWTMQMQSSTVVFEHIVSCDNHIQLIQDLLDGKDVEQDKKTKQLTDLITKLETQLNDAKSELNNIKGC